ncbi:MAG: hypothetical protein H0V87_06095 [Chloroflexi bacterium]|nr:hypothetical protein [Chloroflexota bacterium]
MGASAVVRGILFVVGALMVVGGFAAMTLTAGMTWPGLWLILQGGFLLVVAVLERNRYRSGAAEAASEPTGPGGGETPGQVEPRFRPTNEVFVDPTTERRMRVLLDSRTGERRYVAED